MQATATRRRGPRTRTTTIVEEVETTPTVALRLDRWDDLCAAAGLTTALARADRLRVSTKHIHAVQQGRTMPGAAFIAAALTAFPGTEFADLFAIEDLITAEQ